MTATTDTGRWVTVSTPDGAFTIVADGDTDVVLASGWTDDPAYLTALIHPSIRPGTLKRTRALTEIRATVDAYYGGDFGAIDDVEVRQVSGPFVSKAWPALRTVRAGEPVSYVQLADMAGNPAATRAAATACARNAAALFIPCHRVLRSDGSLGGFRYGLPLKKSLLAREWRHFQART